MIKGTKKALARAPHRLMGSKSSEDRVIIEWTKDFNSAETAFNILISEATRFIKSWKDICSSQEMLVALVGELYQPIQEENVYKAVQETPQSASEAVHSLQLCFNEIQEKVMPLIEELETSFIAKCKEAKEYIEVVQKALKKREHKKIDYDRHSNTVEKLFKKQVHNGHNNDSMDTKDQVQLGKMEKELDEALELFHLHDEKIKRYIPYILTSISEFLNPLTSMLYLTQLKVLETFKTIMFNYALNHGLTTNKTVYEYDDICDEWQGRFTVVQPQCEEGIRTIKNGKTVKTIMTDASQKVRKRDRVRILGSGADLAHRAVSQTRP